MKIINKLFRKNVILLVYIIFMGIIMDIDFKKEEQTFIAELKAGEFAIERIPNEGRNYQENEKRDIIAFEEYLGSDLYKSLAAEAIRK